VNAVTKPHRGRSVGFSFYKEVVVSRAGGRKGEDSTPTFAVNSDGNGSGVPHRLPRCAIRMSELSRSICALGQEDEPGYEQTRFQYLSFAVNLNPKRARPPETIRAIQLTDFGTDQSPIMTGHSIKMRSMWNSATKLKIIAATMQYVFRSMSDHL
jgi:hypothetical protein